VFERNIFFNFKIYDKLAGLSNKFEPSMVFDPSEFEGPKFDCIYFNGVPYFQEKNNSCRIQNSGSRTSKIT
jgi:hypothetical protein